MSKPSHVPKFGNWDANEHVPFTAVFERARADKGTGNKIINPNDPSDNPAAFGIKTDGGPPPSSRRSSQHQYVDERAAADDTHGRPIVNRGGPPRPIMGDHMKRGSHGGARDSEGVRFGEAHNQSAEQSPSNPASAFKGRLGSRPVLSSLGLEKKGSPSPEGGTPHHHPAHPARTRLRPGSRGEEKPDRSTDRSSSALPRFGAWDEKDPTAGDGFTVIFSQARSEKKVGGPTRVPALQSESPIKADYDDAYKPPHLAVHRKASSWACWACCFQARDAM